LTADLVGEGELELDGGELAENPTGA